MKLFELQEQFDAQKFLEDCRPWLDAIRGSRRPAYRGDFRVKDDVQIVKQHTLRRPKDMPTKVHDAINDALDKKFGWRAREHGLFVVGHLEKAKGFGTVGAFFPIGEFKSLWSPDVLDMQENWESFLFDLDKWDYQDAVDGNERQMKRFIEDLFSPNITWHLNLHEKDCLSDSNAELILSAPSFYAFNTELDLWKSTIYPLLKSEGILA